MSQAGGVGQGSGGRAPSTEQQLRSLVDRAELVLWAVDEQGVFTVSEGKGLLALGLAPGQVVGLSAFDVYREHPTICERLRSALAGEEAAWTVEVAGRTFETQSFPLRGEGGRIVGALGLSFDVTERRRAQLENERLQQQLLQVQKLESLGVLAGGIAHDFNNWLAAILGSASTVLVGLPAESPLRAQLDNVVAAAMHAASLTKQLLAYAGKGSFEIRPLDLSTHVRELASVLETTVSKKVQLRLELTEGLPAIAADVGQLQQIVMNLVINGAEAIGDERGTVLITTGLQDADERYVQSLFGSAEIAPGPYVYLEVHDTGCGMDPATTEKIFDPFFTTKFQGRGLGLAAVLGIIRSHKGAIKVYSSPGRGTTFKVFFPARAEAPERVPPAEAPLRGEGLVMVIDDDANVRHALRGLLEHFGFTVEEACDGRQGAARFALLRDRCLLVLLDMTMPELNGEETFRELRSLREDVTVILMSGYNEVEATRRFTAKGLAGFLQKPFTADDLARRVRRALGE